MPNHTSSPHRAAFHEIATLTDDEDPRIVLVITERETDGMLSFAIHREFRRDGMDHPERSFWLRRHHIPAVRRLLAAADQRLGTMEEEARSSRRAVASGT